MSHGISSRKNSLHIDKHKVIRCDTHDDGIGARGFLAPPLRPDADRPCALRLAGAVNTVEPM